MNKIINFLLMTLLFLVFVKIAPIILPVLGLILIYIYRNEINKFFKELLK
jgi:uncharacterized membrane protein